MVAADCNSENDKSLKLPLSKHVDALPISTRNSQSSLRSVCDDDKCVAYCYVLVFPLSLFGLLCFGFIAAFLVQQDQVFHPNFRIADANAVNVTVNLFNNSVDGAVNYLLSGRWNMTLIMENPNPTLPIQYTALHVRLWYKSRDRDVASTHLPPFIHQHMGETRVRLQFTAEKQYVDDDVATHIINGDDNDDGLIFGVTLFLRYEIQRKQFVLDEIDYNVQVDDCYPITGNSSNGPSNSTSTTPCVSINPDYRSGDFYFSYRSDGRLF